MSQSTGKDGDRISHLPDELLTSILSFLSTKDSVRTSLLSTRWKLLWVSVPALRLSDFDFNPKGNPFDPLYAVIIKRNDNFSKFVNRFLLRDRPPMGKLHLSGWGSCPVESWINAVKDHVQQMTLQISDQEFRYPIDPSTEFPKCLFMCKMLVVLKLQVHLALDIPVGSTCFPYLKVLELDSIKFKEGTSVQNLISSCPLLEDLKVIRNMFLCDDLEMPEFTVASPTLKRLTLHFFRLEYEKYIADARLMIVIDTPALQFLDIFDGFSSEFVVGEMRSVSEAKLDLRGRLHNQFTDKSLFAKCLFKLLRAIYNTKYLLLSGITMESLMVADCYEFPTFYKLTQLEILDADELVIDLKFITEFINSSPNMELLYNGSYKFHVKEVDWILDPDLAKVFRWT